MVRDEDDDENEDVDDYFVPLTEQRVFGAGIKHKQVIFVPATTKNYNQSTEQVSSAHGNDIGDRYLSIVLGGSQSTQNSQGVGGAAAAAATSSENQTVVDDENDRDSKVLSCPVCKQPVSSSEVHESSIAHQVCMQHSHPPSHLDRQRKGLKYLSEYGWDPDARQGLGARAEGIRVPIKTKAKHDTVGLGVNAGSSDEDTSTTKRKAIAKQEGKVIKINAKETRRLEGEKRKKAEKLRQAFYGEDYSQYLGSEG